MLPRESEDAPVREVVLVGDGGRARAWLDVVERSPRLSLVSRVARPGRWIGHEGPTFPSVHEAMQAHPGAAFLVAWPPRSALQVALELANAGRQAVVQAPLSASLAEETLPPGASLVHVALGWTTLAGCRVVDQVVTRRAVTRVSLETRGLPEDDSGDLDEAIVHATALVHRLFPRVRLASVERPDEGLVTAVFGQGDTQIALRVLSTGTQLKAQVEGPDVGFHWDVGHGVESFALAEGLGRPPPSRPMRTGAERAVAQLFERERATTLVEARQAMQLAQAVLAGLPSPLPVGRRRFVQAAGLSERRPHDVLAQLGLQGGVPEAPPASAVESAPALDEVWAFRAGLKPVAFLTLEPSQVEATLSEWPRVHVERRQRRVFVDAQDRWVDRRDLGDARVELYLSHDPELARRAADVQSLSDPSAQLRQLGELMGYPSCCIEAFAVQDDRANNTRNRYATVARTRSAGPWPWELNNLVQMLVPFFPCRYDCEAALQWARRALSELERGRPGARQSLMASLSRPVLYFDHERPIVFDGEMHAGRIRYRRARTGPAPGEKFARFAGAVASGDELELTDQSMRVWRGGELVMSLQRTDPALGFIAPFGR